MGDNAHSWDAFFFFQPSFVHMAQSSNATPSHARAIMLGLAIGDALGTTSEGFAPFDFDKTTSGRKRVEATVKELLVTRGRIPHVLGNDPDKREWPHDREWPRDLVGGANRVTHTRPWAPGEVSDDTQTALAILRACVKWRQLDKNTPARLTFLLDEFQRWTAWSPDVGYTMFKVFAWYRARSITVDADLVQANTNSTTHEVFWKSESNGALMRNGGMVSCGGGGKNTYSSLWWNRDDEAESAAACL
jgi:hypothetical protein